MNVRRTGPVIGQPIDPEQERALHDAVFEARWVPKAERLEAWSTPIGIAAGICLLLWMLFGVIIAAVRAHHGALS